MADYLPLDQEGWSKHYNVKSLNEVVRAIEMGEVQVWAKELLEICGGGARAA